MAPEWWDSLIRIFEPVGMDSVLYTRSKFIAANIIFLDGIGALSTLKAPLKKTYVLPQFNDQILVRSLGSHQCLLTRRNRYQPQF